MSGSPSSDEMAAPLGLLHNRLNNTEQFIVNESNRIDFGMESLENRVGEIENTFVYDQYFDEQMTSRDAQTDELHINLGDVAQEAHDP